MEYVLRTRNRCATGNAHSLSDHTFKLVCALALMFTSYAASADVHEKVQDALDWQLPVNSCKKPSNRGNPQGSVAISGTIIHQASNTTADTRGTQMLYDVDPTEINRYERKLGQWQKCVQAYKTELLEHFETLKASAQYGLTQRQAEVIVGKLALIQAAVLSPDGIPASSEPTDPDR